MTLCNGLAAIAHRLCIDDVISTELMALVACRLIPLDKQPDVQPIRVGDFPQRIIANAFLHVISNDVQLSAGALQTCAGHDAGSEAVIHAMRAIFEDNSNYAALLVDATNAFILVNHQAALHNISVLCPSFSTILKTHMVHPLDSLLLVKVNLHPLKALLRVIHLPWLCMPLLLPYWLTHFIIISWMYLRLGLRMMLLLLDS